MSSRGGELYSKDLKPCAVCEGPIVKGFFRIRCQRMAVDMTAVRQFKGLVDMMQGHLKVAQTFESRPIAQPTEDAEEEVFLCLTCAKDILRRVFFACLKN